MSKYYYSGQRYNTKTEDDVEKIHDDMLLDYTGHMNLIYNVPLSRPVNQCIDYIRAYISERIKVKDIAENIGISASYLSQEFSKEVGKTISDYIREKKIEMSREMLINTDLSISEIAYRLSFSSQSHFIQTFSSLTGITPKKFRDNHKQKKWIASDNNEKERYPYLFE